MLYALTRGREWNGDTGNIKNAQAAAWEIFDKNFPFLECSQADADTLDGAQSANDICGGGIVIIGEGDMGQVVTDVWVDFAANQLVVEYGPCCIKRYYLPEIAGDEFGGGDADLPDEPDYPEETADYSRCAKATSIWGVWVDCVDIILDAAQGLTAPWNVTGLLQAAYPSLNFGATQVLHAYTAAISVETQGYASETETTAWMKEVKCAWSQIGAEDGAGWSEDQYNSALSLLSAVANKHFTLAAFPTAFGDMSAVWFYTAQAIGKGDAKDLTTRVVPTGAEDCDCDTPPVLGYGGYYLSPDLAAGHLGRVDGSVYYAGMRQMAGADVYGCIWSFEPYTANGVTKRMSWANSQLPGVVDAGMWVDGSDQIQAILAAGGGLVYFGDSTIGTVLAALAGISTTVWKMSYEPFGTKLFDEMDVLGSHIQIGTDDTIVTAKFHYIYKDA